MKQIRLYTLMTSSYGGDPRPDLVPADPISLSDGRSSSYHGPGAPMTIATFQSSLTQWHWMLLRRGSSYAKCLSVLVGGDEVEGV